MSSLEGTILEFSFQQGVGRLRLDDGRELTYDVDACGRVRLGDVVPKPGERVSVTLGPARLGGERVVEVKRLHPREIPDETPDV